MNSNYFGSVFFRRRVQLPPWLGDPEHYVHQIDGRIRLWREGDGPNKTAGRIMLMVVKLAEARRAGVSVSDLFGCYDIDELDTVLFDDEGNFSAELPIKAPYGDLLVITEVRLKLRYCDARLRSQAIEAAIASFATIGVVVIKKHVLRLSVEAQLDKGYVDLLCNDFLMRDNCRLHN